MINCICDIVFKILASASCFAVWWVSASLAWADAGGDGGLPGDDVDGGVSAAGV